MSECTHDCSSCTANCPSKGHQSAPQDFHEAPNALSSIKKVVGVVSGKGGVGKSLVTCMTAVLMQRRGYHVGILDADVTGPSVPKAFGIHEDVTGDEHGLIPPRTKTGIDLMSVNLLLDDEKRPVVWRGPVIAGLVKQFWSDVHWGELDIIFVDMPPGTGDVPLTVFQSLPVDGVVVVSTPQDLVEMIVSKSVKMAGMMKKKVLGLVENMSYLKCPDCGKEISVFGESKAEALAKKFDIPEFFRMPINPEFAKTIDVGAAETLEIDGFGEFAKTVIRGL